jgi:beta-lactam-binding protein with PASTA domain
MRVVREVRVAIPDVIGADAETTQAQLETLGLKVKRASGGGFLEPLLPGDPKVCESRPKAGTQVLPGSVVTLVTARQC